MSFPCSCCTDNTATHTEFVVPALRHGARIFLTHRP